MPERSCKSCETNLLYKATLVNYFTPDSGIRKGHRCEWLHSLQRNRLPELMQPVTLAPSQHLMV